VKWHKGNDVWALAMVDFEDYSSSSFSPELQSLL